MRYQVTNTITVIDNPDGKTHRITRDFLENEQWGSSASRHRIVTVGIKSVPEALKMEFIDMLSLYENDDSKMAQAMVQKFIITIDKYNTKEKK